MASRDHLAGRPFLTVPELDLESTRTYVEELAISIAADHEDMISSLSQSRALDAQPSLVCFSQCVKDGAFDFNHSIADSVCKLRELVHFEGQSGHILSTFVGQVDESLAELDAVLECGKMDLESSIENIIMLEQTKLDEHFFALEDDIEDMCDQLHNHLAQTKSRVIDELSEAMKSFQFHDAQMDWILAIQNQFCSPISAIFCDLRVSPDQKFEYIVAPFSIDQSTLDESLSDIEDCFTRAKVSFLGVIQSLAETSLSEFQQSLFHNQLTESISHIQFSMNSSRDLVCLDILAAVHRANRWIARLGEVEAQRRQLLSSRVRLAQANSMQRLELACQSAAASVLTQFLMPLAKLQRSLSLEAIVRQGVHAIVQTDREAHTMNFEIFQLEDLIILDFGIGELITSCDMVVEIAKMNKVILNQPQQTNARRHPTAEQRIASELLRKSQQGLDTFIALALREALSDAEKTTNDFLICEDDLSNLLQLLRDSCDETTTQAAKVRSRAIKSRQTIRAMIAALGSSERDVELFLKNEQQFQEKWQPIIEQRGEELRTLTDRHRVSQAKMVKELKSLEIRELEAQEYLLRFILQYAFSSFFLSQHDIRLLQARLDEAEWKLNEQGVLPEVVTTHDSKESGTGFNGSSKAARSSDGKSDGKLSKLDELLMNLEMSRSAV